MSTLTAVCELTDAIEALKKDESAGSYQVADLKDCDYERDSKRGSLNWHGRKFELNEWSSRQLCKIAGIPFSVWSKVSGPLATDLTRELVKGIKDTESERKMILRTYGKKEVVRGIVPMDYPDTKNSEVLEAIHQTLKVPYVVQSAKWLDATSTPWVRTRIVLTDGVFNFKKGGEDIMLGLDIASSEVGGGDFLVNILLYQQTCTNGTITTYGKKAYFAYDYSPGISFHIPDIMTAAVDRAAEDAGYIADCVGKAQALKLDNDGAVGVLDQMLKNNTLNKGIVVKSQAMIESDKKKVTTLWELVSIITEVAQGYRDELRLRYETVGGSMMGMRLDRKPNTPEEKFDTTPKGYLLPVPFDTQSLPVPPTVGP